MRVKLDFVTNSSSMCYVLDKSTLSEDELEKVRANSWLAEPHYYGLGRSSAYAEGQAVKRFFEYLFEDDTEFPEWPNSQTNWLRKLLDKIGIENIIFVRWSDEDMGGRVQNLDLIEKKAVAEMEYH